MKVMRFSIARLMILIAILALNIGLARVVYLVDPELLLGAALPCFLLQWAIYSVARGRDRKRAFWFGYFLVGSLITTSFFWALVYQPSIGIDPITKRILVTSKGSLSYQIWSNYIDWIEERLATVLPASVTASSWFVPPVIILVSAAPQILSALAGGLAAYLLLRLNSAHQSAALITPPQAGF